MAGTERGGDPYGSLRMQEVAVSKQTDEYCYLEAGLEEGDVVVNKNALLVYNALK